MKNYDRTVHIASWECEKAIAEKFSDLLTWNNSNWNQIDTYDSAEKGLPDFNVKRTNIKIEMQFVKDAYSWIYLQKRRIYEVNNVAGQYGRHKDLKDTWLLLTNGVWFKILDLENRKEYKEIDNFVGKRQDYERVYLIPQTDFNKIDLDFWILAKQIENNL